MMLLKHNCQEVAADTDASDQLKRRRSGSIDIFTQCQLRVKALSGKHLISLTEYDAFGLTVRQLQEIMVKTLSTVDEVKLVFRTRQLEEEELLEEIMRQENPCEITCITQKIPQLDPSIPALEQLDALKALLHSASDENQLTSTTEIRKLLCIDDPPIDQVIGYGLLPRLLDLAKQSSLPAVKLNALWALTNVASGSHEQAKALVDLDVATVAINVLSIEVAKGPAHAKIVEHDIIAQALQLLGNICFASIESRALCLNRGALAILLQIIQWKDVHPRLERCALWALSLARLTGVDVNVASGLSLAPARKPYMGNYRWLLLAFILCMCYRRWFRDCRQWYSMFVPFGSRSWLLFS